LEADTMIKTAIALLAVLSLSACNKPTPMNTETMPNGVIADLVAVVDGCRVWRLDEGNIKNPVFLARCPEGAVTTQTEHASPCGKGCVTMKPDTILGDVR
jgi:hypothetical protein